MRLAIVALITIAAATAPAAARCHGDHVIGRDPCATFGGWRLRSMPLNDTTEVGVSMFALAVPSPGAIFHADGTAAQVGAPSGHLIGAGIHLRVLRAVRDYLSVGLEILPGTLVGPSAASVRVDGMPAAITSGSVGHGLLLVGVHTGRELQLGFELAGGFGGVATTTMLPAGDSACRDQLCPVATASSWLVAEARAQLRWWASPWITITASAGIDDHETREIALDFGLHFIAYDGR